MAAAGKKSILLVGGTGLVGKRLVQLLDKNKYEITVLTRKPKPEDTEKVRYVKWDPNRLNIEKMLQPEHVINLAGEGIADQRWTNERKEQLISSRVGSAAAIKKYLEEQKITPLSYISASAVGYYGDRDDELLTEESKSGMGFLSECCKLWESAAALTGTLCQRTVILRIGIVLSAHGGALPKMTMTSGLGVFNYFGKGDQYYPWIHIDDLCKMIIYSIENESITGTYNACAPIPVTNKQMISAIKNVKNSNGITTPVPAMILKLALGEMAAVVLDSSNVSSKKIQKAGFKFQFNNVTEALEELI